MQITRRHLFVLGSTTVAGAALAGCATFAPYIQHNSDGSYGLSAQTIAYIQQAVSYANKYVPAAESIAAIAASLFGPQYSAMVVVGSSAANQIIAALENLLANPPKVGVAGRAYARFGIPTPSRNLVGYTRSGIPVFAA
jgi:hypothetical protein